MSLFLAAMPVRNPRRSAAFSRQVVETHLERQAMMDRETDRKMEQLDRLLNDPEVRMEPDLVWSLLADVSRNDRLAAAATN